eukprot:Plantae.Rhodophyta-Purpureofilum_apyrenoidigerum.ctg11012.p1 GENE.Plantae.Rhodophyta-Purpureofilum_apyrenoidigerum.ctg11012~~Plantae.Rhodophyta-Purpureofilum_apyrenoidigerum.ctg11012.p1  ORF type:complete len:193 (+),score=32.22 Plantae.Rhodophyta-Purpureofilum_apyrenoidigerum.ctg11012:51-581(+)
MGGVGPLSIQFLLNTEDVPVRGVELERLTSSSSTGSNSTPLNANMFERIPTVGRKKHMRFSCDQCGKFFRMQRDLRHHVKCVHEKLRPHQCTQCDAKFSIKPNLSRHIRTVHEGMKPFECSICSKAFGLKENLDKHIRLVHEKQRPFTCEHCGYSFGIMSALKRHIRKFHPNSALQ